MHYTVEQLKKGNIDDFFSENKNFWCYSTSILKNNANK